MSGSGARVALTLLICLGVASGGGWLGARVVGTPFTHAESVTEIEIFSKYELRDGVVLLGNPYTCALRSRHLAQLQHLADSLHVSVRFFVPVDSMESDVLTQITDDFGRTVPAESMSRAEARALIRHDTPAFPVLLVVRSGKVTAIVESPFSQRLIGRLPLLYGAALATPMVAPIPTDRPESR